MTIVTSVQIDELRAECAAVCDPMRVEIERLKEEIRRIERETNERAVTGQGYSIGSEFLVKVSVGYGLRAKTQRQRWRIEGFTAGASNWNGGGVLARQIKQNGEPGLRTDTFSAERLLNFERVS